VLDGPLAPYIDSFTQSLSDQGFVPESARSKTRLAADFSRWLKKIDVVLPAITDEHIARYLRYRSRHRQPRSSDGFVLKQLLKFLHQQGVLEEAPTVPVKVTPIQQLLDEYTVYLQRERVLSVDSIDIYVPFARGFLAACFRDGEKIKLTSLRAADVIAFVQDSIAAGSVGFTCRGNRRAQTG